MSELSSPDCIFCKLSAEPASHEIYRDDEIFAILVLCPIRPGHALILPRAHYPYFDDMPVNIAARIMKFGQHLGRIQKRIFSVDRAAFLYTGGDIPHAHAHVLPLHEKTDITSTRYILENDLTFSEAPAAQPGELLDVAGRLRSALTG